MWASAPTGEFVLRIRERRLTGRYSGVAQGEDFPVQQGKSGVYIGFAVIAAGEMVGVAMKVKAQDGHKGQSRLQAGRKEQPQPSAAVAEQPGTALLRVLQGGLAQGPEKILHGAEAAAEGFRQGSVGISGPGRGQGGKV